MNHIICGHYHANCGCGKCLKEVFTTGQPLKDHMKVCKGLPKEAANEAYTGSAYCTPTTPEKKRCMSKDPSPGLQLPPPRSSQGSFQASPHQSQHAKKKLALLLRSQTPATGRRNAPSTTNITVRTNPARSPAQTSIARKSPTKSLARSLVRSPARRSAMRRRSRERRSGTTLTTLGRTSPARSEPAPPSPGGAPNTPVT